MFEDEDTLPIEPIFVENKINWISLFVAILICSTPFIFILAIILSIAVVP